MVDDFNIHMYGFSQVPTDNALVLAAVEEARGLPYLPYEADGTGNVIWPVDNGEKVITPAIQALVDAVEREVQLTMPTLRVSHIDMWQGGEHLDFHTDMTPDYPYDYFLLIYLGDIVWDVTVGGLLRVKHQHLPDIFTITPNAGVAVLINNTRKEYLHSVTPFDRNAGARRTVLQVGLKIKR